AGPVPGGLLAVHARTVALARALAVDLRRLDSDPARDHLVGAVPSGDPEDGLGLARAALPPSGADLLELLHDGRIGRPHLDLGMARGEEHEAGLGERVRVGGEDAQRAALG